MYPTLVLMIEESVTLISADDITNTYMWRYVSSSVTTMLTVPVFHQHE